MCLNRFSMPRPNLSGLKVRRKVDNYQINDDFPQKLKTGLDLDAVSDITSRRVGHECHFRTTSEWAATP